MEKVIFMSLMPDDYHGAPMISNFTSDDFPIPPSKQEAFNAWSNAGYNAWEWREEDPDYDEDDTEEDYFNRYGNSECYYSIYMIFTNSNNIKQLKDYIEGDLDEGSEYGNKRMSVDEVCEIIRNVPGVIDVYIIDFNK